MSNVATFVGADYLIAGVPRTFDGDDFIFQKNGVIQSIAPEVAQLTITSISGHASGTSNTVNPYKHYNSTSSADDVANGHPNTVNEDFLTTSVTIVGTIRDTELNDVYDIAYFTLTYYSAAYSPNFPIERVRGLYRSSANDYAGAVINSTINAYSPTKPNATSPYSASELIGYAPNMVGNVKIKDIAIGSSSTILLDGKRIVQAVNIFKYPITDIPLSGFYVKAYNQSNVELAVSNTVDLTSEKRGTASLTFDLSNSSVDNIQVPVTFKAYDSGNTERYSFGVNVLVEGKKFNVDSYTVNWTGGTYSSITFLLSKSSSIPSYPSTMRIKGTYSYSNDGITWLTGSIDTFANLSSGSTYAFPLDQFTWFTRSCAIDVLNDEGRRCGTISSNNPNSYTPPV